ncbi:MPP_superfamily domain containing protein [Flavobacteriaceae bacterium]|jgi:hypothetical protein
MAHLDLPYLQAPSATSILVSWISNFEVKPEVFYGLKINNLTKKAYGNSTLIEENHVVNHVQIQELQPNTRYFYRTKSGDQLSEVYSFKTQVDQTQHRQKLRFIVIGDHQRFDEAFPNLVEKASAKALEIWNGTSIEETVNFVMNLGDQVHNGGELSHYRMHHFHKSSRLSTKVPFTTVLGNHELYGDPEAKNYFAHFDYSSLNYKGIKPKNTDNETEYYSFRIGKALFLHLNSNSNCVDQTHFVSQIIQKADKDDEIDWIFAAAHHPPRAEQLKKDGNDYICNVIIPILQSSAKTSIYFAGHAHLYARGANRNHRIHEIINGGASWDQYWTDAPDAITLYEDVQKTLEAHVFQLVELDFEKEELQVLTYSTGNALKEKPLHLLDYFYKKKKENRPETPAINNLPEKITLPFTFKGTDYSGDEPLNSSEFEIIKIIDTNEIVGYSKKRDYEKWFGSSGTPNFSPINIHHSTSILSLTVNENELETGVYRIRVRYRDQNLSWSEWSKTATFVIE